MNGYWGNKDCEHPVCQVHGVSICVLNCHLAAHDQFNQARIDSYNTVLQNSYLKDQGHRAHHVQRLRPWMGDLNFRLEENTFNFQEIGWPSQNKLSQLLAVDQLSAARKSGAAFSELSETLPSSHQLLQ